MRRNPHRIFAKAPSGEPDMRLTTSPVRYADLGGGQVQAEWLDELDPADARAVRSRRDLQRVNAWMGHVGLAIRALQQAGLLEPPTRLVEIGGGDGTFLLRIAQRMSARWPKMEVMLVDRLSLVAPRTRDAFAKLGWTMREVTADVFEWLNADPGDKTGVMLANLFLHHFAAEQLKSLLCQVAERNHCFVACEPERSRLALAGARLLWLIGCNQVTRHDGLISVQAGFRGAELTHLWPTTEFWQLTEKAAGAFSHLFLAVRRSAAPASHA